MYHAIAATDSDLLSDWRWLVGENARTIGWSSSGDLFYADERSCVWHLDTGAGGRRVGG